MTGAGTPVPKFTGDLKTKFTGDLKTKIRSLSTLFTGITHNSATEAPKGWSIREKYWHPAQANPLTWARYHNCIWAALKQNSLIWCNFWYDYYFPASGGLATHWNDDIWLRIFGHCSMNTNKRVTQYNSWRTSHKHTSNEHIEDTSCQKMTQISLEVHYTRGKSLLQILHQTETHVEASFPALNLKCTVNPVNLCNEGPLVKDMYAETRKISEYLIISVSRSHPACKGCTFVRKIDGMRIYL